MRIIERVAWETERKCTTCGSTLGVHKEDIKFRTHRDISQCVESLFEFQCPVCLATNEVSPSSLPVHIQESARRPGEAEARLRGY